MEKNEEKKDDVISIEAAKVFFEQASTPPGLKRMLAFPDVNTHVIPSRLLSKDLPEVREATYRFAEEVLGLEGN